MDRTRRQETNQRAELLNESPIGTLERGLLLLETFDADNPEMSLNELRERTGLPKATIQRLMKTLEARDGSRYESSTRKYHLGASVLRISYLAASHSELVRVTHPFLVRLAEETRETASLCVLDRPGTAHGRYCPHSPPLQAGDEHRVDPRRVYCRWAGARSLRPRGGVGHVSSQSHAALHRTDRHRPCSGPRTLANRQRRRCGVRQGRVEPGDPRCSRPRLRSAGATERIDGYRTSLGTNDRRSDAQLRRALKAAAAEISKKLV